MNPDVNIVDQLKTLRRRLSGQRPATQPPESTVRRALAQRARPVNPYVRSLITLSLALLVAACGGGSAGASSNPGGSSGGNGSGGDPSGQPAASAPADDPGEAQGAGGLCDLLPQADAAAALGEPVDGGTYKRSSISGTDICRYTATGSEHMIQIEHSAGETLASWEEAIDGAGMLDEEPLTGIGEAAYRSDNAVFGPGTRLTAYGSGSSIWVVIASDADQATVFETAEAVAKDLLAAVNA